jgi:hypothetical protein
VRRERLDILGEAHEGVDDADPMRWTRSSVKYIQCGGHDRRWSGSGAVETVFGGVDPVSWTRLPVA